MFLAETEVGSLVIALSLYLRNTQDSFMYLIRYKTGGRLRHSQWVWWAAWLLDWWLGIGDVAIRLLLLFNFVSLYDVLISNATKVISFCFRSFRLLPPAPHLQPSKTETGQSEPGVFIYTPMSYAHKVNDSKPGLLFVLHFYLFVGVKHSHEMQQIWDF